MLMHKSSTQTKKQHSSAIDSSSTKLFMPIKDVNNSKQEETESLILEETKSDANGANGILPSVQTDEPTKPEVT